MKVNIVSSGKNKLLDRKELEFEVQDSKTSPTRKEIVASLAALNETKPENVVIEKINSGFGAKNFTGTARIYADTGKMGKIENKHLGNRDKGIKEERKKKEKPAPGKGKK